MNDDFSNRIKKIEQELLDLKTSSLYTSIRNTVTAFAGTVSTGVYRVDYNNSGENIISDVYTNRYKQTSGSVSLRTPQGSYQLIDVDTTDRNTGIPSTTSLVVVSNVPVVSITRVS